MKRLLIAVALLLGFIAPVQAFEMLIVPVTTAVTAVSPTYQVRQGSGGQQLNNIAIQCALTYGSGGTTIDAYVQTSLDGGQTWIDVVHCGFTTASSKVVYNLSATTPNTTAVVPTDGTLAGAVAKDGIIGSQWRVKYITVGTYVATTLDIDASASLATFP